MADKQFSVYYLLDPVTHRVRYVGCSCRPSARLEDHLEARGDSHRARWTRKLFDAGLQPEFVLKCVLETEEEMFRVEIALIARLREMGEPLTNMTAGGDGIINPLPEVRAKRSEALLGNTRGAGHVHSEETKRQMSESRKRFNKEHPEIVEEFAARQIGNKHGLNQSQESREKRRREMAGTSLFAGHKHTEEWKAAQALRKLGNLSRTGMTNSVESNARRSASCSALWTEERRTEKALSQLGKTHSEESKAKNAESARRMWARRKLAKLSAILYAELDSYDVPSMRYEDMTQ